MPINGGSRKVPITLPGSPSSSRAGHMSLLRSLDTSDCTQRPLGKDTAALWNEQKRKIFGGVYFPVLPLWGWRTIMWPWGSQDEAGNSESGHTQGVKAPGPGWHVRSYQPMSKCLRSDRDSARVPFCVSTCLFPSQREDSLLILSYTFLFCLDFPFFLSLVSTALCPQSSVVFLISRPSSVTAVQK